MVHRVLLSLDDVVLASGVAPLLQNAGYEAVIVAEPAELHRRGGDPAVVAVVAQDSYLDGSDGATMLRELCELRGKPVPAVLICSRPPGEDYRTPLARELAVRAFLNASTSPESVLRALEVATGGIDPEDTNPFETQARTMSEGADPFDLLVELQEVVEEDEPETDPHREVTRTVAIPVPPEARGVRDEDPEEAAEAAFDEDFDAAFDDTEDAAFDDSEDAAFDDSEDAAFDDTEDPAFGAPLDALPPPLPLAATQNARVLAADETSIDLNVMTLGIEQIMAEEVATPAPPGQAEAAVVEEPEEEEDMARIQELEEQLARQRAACEKAEAEREKLQRIARERTDAERRLKDRVQKLEKALETAEAASKAGGADQNRLKLLEAELKELRRYKEAADRKLRKQDAELKSSQAAVPDLAGGMFDDDDTPPPSEGRFEQIPYPRLLGRLLKQGFSGAMDLRTGGGTREIFYVDGKPVAYSSASPGERLGRILVEQQRITEEQYLKATSRMVERGVKLTDALLELGFITSEHLDEQQRYLTRDQIVGGFGFTEGQFTLREGEAPPEDAARFDFSPGEIYVAGYRQYAPEGEVNALYETMRRLYLKPTEEMASYRPQLGLEAEDERLLRLLGQAYTTEEAVARAHISEERAARILGALRGLGLITAWNPGSSQFEDRVQETTQEHQAALLQLREELQEREDRLVDTFEKALARIEGGAGSGPALTGASLAERRDSSLSVAPEEHTQPHIHRDSLRREASPPSASRAEPAAKEPVVKEPVAAEPPPPAEAEAEVKSALDEAFGGAPSPPADSGTAVTPPGGNAAPPPSEPPQSPAEAKFREGMNRAAQGQLDEAETALREAVRLDAAQPSYLAALARVLLSNPKYDRSGTLPVVRSLLDRAQALGPEDDEVRALLARVTSEQAQLE